MQTPSLSSDNQDYSGQNLRGRSFKSENLKNSNFSGADIRGANFTGADIQGANFTNADIRGANFTKANFKNADITNANFENADFTNAKAGLQLRWTIILAVGSLLVSVILAFFASLAGALAGGTLEQTKTTLLESFVIVLITVSVICIVARRWGLSNAGLLALSLLMIATAAWIWLTILQITNNSAKFNSFSSLAWKAVSIAWVAGGTLCEAVFSAICGAAFSTVCEFTFSKVLGAIFGSTCMIFVWAKFGTAFTNGSLDGALYGAIAVLFIGGLLGIDICRQALVSDKNKLVWIRTGAIAYAAIRGTSFHSANLTKANFTGATLKSTDFREAILTRTCFYKTKKLDRACLGSSYLQNAELRQLLITGDGQGKNFENQILQGLNLSKANFAYANLINTNFYKSYLKEANLEGALLVRAQFESADLSEATLTGACIEDWIVTKTTHLYGVKCKYVFLKIYECKDKYEKIDRMPLKGEFKNDDFVLFVQSIIDTIKFYHERDVNPNLALRVLQTLSEDYDCSLEIVKVEKRGESGAIIEVKIPGNLNEEKLKESYYEKYERYLKLYMNDPKNELKPSIALKNITIHRGVLITGNVIESTVADTINQGDTTNYAPEQRQNLAEAAAEIQKLLKQLEQTNPTATETEKVAYVNDETTPSFKRRVVGALQAGGETAIDEFILENKYLKVAKATIKGWLQPGS
ncbi:MAG: pentapeptide repeat-containing protein [Nostoc sp. DedQUE01]